MDSAKVKFISGSFDLTYPQSLQSVIPPDEFETTIRTLNSKSETKMDRKNYLFLIPSLVGFVLIPAGFAIKSIALGACGVLLFIIGFVCFLVLLIRHGMAHEAKIQQEVDIINQHYSSRRIEFSLGHEKVYRPLTQFELDSLNRHNMQSSKFNNHNSHNSKFNHNSKFKNHHNSKFKHHHNNDSIHDVHRSHNENYLTRDIEYDQYGRPCKAETQHFLLITFPAADKSSEENQSDISINQLQAQNFVQNHQFNQQPNFNFNQQPQFMQQAPQQPQVNYNMQQPQFNYNNQFSQSQYSTQPSQQQFNFNMQQPIFNQSQFNQSQFNQQQFNQPHFNQSQVNFNTQQENHQFDFTDSNSNDLNDNSSNYSEDNNSNIDNNSNYNQDNNSNM